METVAEKLEQTYTSKNKPKTIESRPKKSKNIKFFKNIPEKN